MKTLQLSIVLLIMGLTSSIIAQEEHEFSSDGIDLLYYAYEPSNSGRSSQMSEFGSVPVFIAIPPQTRAGKGTTKTAVKKYWVKALTDAGFLVIAPVVQDRRFHSNAKGREDIKPIIADVIENYPDASEKRVIVGGAGDGAGDGALVVAAHAPELFAGVAVTPGTTIAIKRNELTKLNNMPVFIRVGYDDDLWKAQVQASAKLLTNAGAKVDYDTIIDQSHDIKMSRTETREMVRWLKSAVEKKIEPVAATE